MPHLMEHCLRLMPTCLWDWWVKAGRHLKKNVPVQSYVARCNTNMYCLLLHIEITEFEKMGRLEHHII